MRRNTKYKFVQSPRKKYSTDPPPPMQQWFPNYFDRGTSYY